MNDRRRGLGRGLGALIPTGTSTIATTAPASSPVSIPVVVPDHSAPAATGLGAPTEADSVESLPQAAVQMPVQGAWFAEIALDDITPNPRQPREEFDEDALEELVHSIREFGLLQPIVVRQLGEPGDSRYELIMGERRWRAARRAGLEAIPAIVRETDDDKLLLDALLENLHRAQLNPLEEAAAYDQLLREFSCTQEVLADRIGRSRSQVTNTLRLLTLPPEVQRRVAAGVLSAGHGRALAGLSDADEQISLAKRVVAEGISVRSLEEIVQLMPPTKKRVSKVRAGGRQPVLTDLAGRLSDRFETRVRVDLGQKKGKIVVEFASLEDLERILATMAPGETQVLSRLSAAEVPAQATSEEAAGIAV